MKKVFGQIGRLKPECIELYRRLHEQDVYTPRWAGVLEKIHDCNMQNYSIFIEDDVVFGYFVYGYRIQRYAVEHAVIRSFCTKVFQL